jgi:putative ABC transport system substrate-binding protein
MLKKCLFYRILQLTLIILSMSAALVSPAKSTQILIIANSEKAPYLQAIQGFKEQFSSQLSIDYSIHYLSQDKNKQKELSATILTVKPDLIFALGGAAAKLASQSTSSIPIVSTMVLKRSVLQKAGNMTGVSLNYPFSIQFQWLKKFFPEKSKVAIFYNPKQNQQSIETAKKIAQQTGLELFAIPVESPKQLPYALEQLGRNIEILLAIPDKIAMSSKTAKAVLLASFRNKVPLIGLSDNWVKSGALYALSWSYPALGRQCAIQAEKLFAGVPIQKISPEYPEPVAYSINAKTASHMHVSIADNLLKNAKKTFN